MNDDIEFFVVRGGRTPGAIQVAALRGTDSVVTVLPMDASTDDIDAAKDRLREELNRVAS